MSRAMSRAGVLCRILAYTLAIAIICGSAVGRAQSAAAQRRSIVFEAHVGEPSLVETMLLTRLRDELETLGLVAQPASLLRTVGGRVPRPGIADPDVTLAEIAQLVDAGYNAFTSGDFTAAIEKLTKAIRLIRRNPALLVLDTGNGELVVRAYVSLGFSQNKRKPSVESAEKVKVPSEIQDPRKLTPEAEATLSELIRMYPSMLALQHDYGPIAERSYRALYSRVIAKGHGQLVVRVKNERAMIFIDQQMRGLGTVKVAELLVGSHQVFVQMAGGGRRYEVDIAPNEETVLEIDPDVDASLWIGDDRTWFQFATEIERRREARCSAELARRWDTGDTIAVIGPMEVQGKPAIIGTLYRLNGEAARPTAFVPVEQADAASIHSLALYIANGAPGNGLRIVPHGGPSDERSWTSQNHGSMLLPGILLGTGAAVVIGGGVVYVTSKADDFTMPTFNDKHTPAVWGMTGGSAVLGAGTYLWLREVRSIDALTSAALGGGLAAIVAGTELYLTDLDDHVVAADLYQRQYYRDTATLGVTLGVSGLAMTGFGAWRLYHYDKSTSRRQSSAMRQDLLRSILPVVTVMPSRASVGFAGTF